MIDDQVGQVRIRVKTDLPDSGEFRSASERMVRATLERCGEILEARHPGRVVIVRSLPLRWRADESLLEDSEAVEELAQAAASSIERMAVSNVTADHSAKAPGVIFEDEAQLRASHLVALVRGAPLWFHAFLEERDTRSALGYLALPEHRELAWSVLLRLAREDALAEVLANIPSLATEVFAAALGVGSPYAQARSDELLADLADPRIAAELIGMSARWPQLSTVAQLLALRVHAAVMMDTTPESQEAVMLASTIANSMNRDAAMRSVIAPEAAAEARERVKRAKQLDIQEEQLATAEPPETPEEAEQEAPELVWTGCAGIFYLLERMQELDIPESLWKVCLPEGEVLAAAMSALLGDAFADDPAPRLFGGVDTVECPTISPEQLEEIAAATCASLAAALPRRQLAEIPPCSLALIEHGPDRLLVASAEGSPFVFFAWPANDASAIVQGLRAFLQAWSSKGVVTTAPALAGLDGSGRVQPPRAGEPKPVPLFVPEADSAVAAALLSIVAGAPCLLFAERAGTAGDREAFLQRIALRAKVATTSAEMQVVLRAEDVDDQVRRAGLDRDPGWLPWLQRTVRFLYEDGESLE
jgi:hypothetical protein